MHLNFTSYFAMCKFALPHLRKTKGNIINMSSWTGIFGQKAAPTYSATKGAITCWYFVYALSWLSSLVVCMLGLQTVLCRSVPPSVPPSLPLRPSPRFLPSLSLTTSTHLSLFQGTGH